MKKENKILLGVLIALTITSTTFYYCKQRENYATWLNSDINNINSLQSDNLFICSEINFDNYYHGNKYILVVFFEPTQCGSCLNEQTLWEKIARKNIVPIIGITSLQDSIELNSYMDQAKPNFPVLLEPGACLQRKLNIPDTPCKILINKAGKIILVDYVRKTDQSKENYLRNLTKFIHEN